MNAGKINDIQIQHYGEIKCDSEEIVSWLSFIKQQRIAGAKIIEIPISEARKLSLQGTWAT
jgi:hypothetical protein